MWPFFLAIILSGFGVLGDYFLKRAGQTNTLGIKSFLVGVLIYILLAFGWTYTLKHIKLSTLGVIYAVTTSILLVGVGVIFFKEHLAVREIIGIILALLSLTFLYRFL